MFTPCATGHHQGHPHSPPIPQVGRNGSKGEFNECTLIPREYSLPVFTVTATGDGSTDFTSAPVLYVVSHVISTGHGRELDGGDIPRRWMDIGWFSLSIELADNPDGLPDGDYCSEIYWVNFIDQTKAILNQNQNQFNSFYWSLWGGAEVLFVGYSA